MKVKDLWCRYEWQHHSSLHLRGFLWLEGEPNVDTIDWSNEVKQNSVERYFDSTIHA